MTDSRSLLREPPLEYRPRFPADYRPGVGIVGFGGVVKGGHLPAYAKYGVQIAGVFDVSREAVAEAEALGVGKVFESLEALLEDPAVEIVDVATWTSERPKIVAAAIRAGKHVLAQKPFAGELGTAAELVEQADERGVTLAVNQNGRWAPPWRLATLLIEDGAIGDVVAIDHHDDTEFRPPAGHPFDLDPHSIVFDYLVHWVDISRCWLASKEIVTVRARDYRPPHQPAAHQTPWGAWIEIECADGANALIRQVGCAPPSRRDDRHGGNAFRIYGSEGVITGNLDPFGTDDHLELQRGSVVTTFGTEGKWWPDGFAGAMGELQSAVAEGREPYNSGRHVLRSLQLALAAVDSSEANGAPVDVRVACG